MRLLSIPPDHSGNGRNVRVTSTVTFEVPVTSAQRHQAGGAVSCWGWGGGMEGAAFLLWFTDVCSQVHTYCLDIPVRVRMSVRESVCESTPAVGSVRYLYPPDPSQTPLTQPEDPGTSPPTGSVGEFSVCSRILWFSTCLLIVHTHHCYRQKLGLKVPQTLYTTNSGPGIFPLT